MGDEREQSMGEARRNVKAPAVAFLSAHGMQIQLGDFVVSVNGTPVSSESSLPQVDEMMRKSPKYVQLQLVRAEGGSTEVVPETPPTSDALGWQHRETQLAAAAFATPTGSSSYSSRAPTPPTDESLLSSPPAPSPSELCYELSHAVSSLRAAMQQREQREREETTRTLATPRPSKALTPRTDSRTDPPIVASRYSREAPSTKTVDEPLWAPVMRSPITWAIVLALRCAAAHPSISHRSFYHLFFLRSLDPPAPTPLPRRPAKRTS